MACYDLRKLIGLILISAGLLIMGAGCQEGTADYSYKGTQLDPPQPLPDFELADTDGHPFRLKDGEGKLSLIYFGYTHCPDVCPLTLADVKEALRGLEAEERVQVIFITLDPERDTPERLAHYLRAFAPGFIGLTGDPQTLREVAKPYRVVAEKEGGEHPAANYLVNHTPHLYLVNPEGELLLIYTFDFDPADLRSDLEHLIQTIKS